MKKQVMMMLFITIALHGSNISAMSYLQRGREYVTQSIPGQYAQKQWAAFRTIINDSNIRKVSRQWRAGELSWKDALYQIRKEAAITYGILLSLSAAIFILGLIHRSITNRPTAATNPSEEEVLYTIAFDRPLTPNQIEQNIRFILSEPIVSEEKLEEAYNYLNQLPENKMKQELRNILQQAKEEREERGASGSFAINFLDAVKNGAVILNAFINGFEENELKNKITKNQYLLALNFAPDDETREFLLKRFGSWFK